MSLTDDDLEAAILFPAVATAMIEIVKKCHYPMGQFARLEKERRHQQDRANREAVERCTAEERVALLTDLLTRARGRLNGSVGISAMSLMCEIDEVLAPRQEPNAELARPASEPVSATGADGLGSGGLLGGAK